MGWISEKFSDGLPVDTSSHSAAAEAQPLKRPRKKSGNQLSAGFDSDVNEINQRQGDAASRNFPSHQARISSRSQKLRSWLLRISLRTPFNMSISRKMHTTAVPEQGVLTMRPSGSSIRSLLCRPAPHL